MLETCPVVSEGPARVSPCHRVLTVLVMMVRDTQCLSLSPFPEALSSASVAWTSISSALWSPALVH